MAVRPIQHPARSLGTAWLGTGGASAIHEHVWGMCKLSLKVLPSHSRGDVRMHGGPAHPVCCAVTRQSSPRSRLSSPGQVLT